MHQFWTILSIAFLLLASCESSDSESQFLTEKDLIKKKTLVQQVMAVHDEAMPWLDDIHQLKKLMISKKDTLNNDSMNVVIDQLIFSLDSADETMMSWMRNYREPNDAVGIDSIETYLTGQFDKASIMRNYMNSTIEETRQFIEQ